MASDIQAQKLTEEVNRLGLMSAQQVSINTESKLIVISEDKLKLALIDYQENRLSRGVWVAPFGIMLTILVAVITTDFRPTFGIEAAVLKAGFYFALVASAGWFLFSLFQMRKSESIEDLIKRLSASV